MAKGLKIGVAVFAVGILALWLWYRADTPNVQYNVEDIIAEDIEEEQAEYLFGIEKAPYTVIKDEVKKNENLSDILLQYGIPYPQIMNIAAKSKDVFDVRYIKAGKAYTVFMPTDDTLNKAAYFVYENSLVNYTIFDLRNDSIYAGQKPVYNERKVVQGVIQSSLALTLQEIKASPLLTLSLSDIYAWTIDFYRLQKGDKFKVIYSENYVDGKSVGIDKIIACEFTHAGDPYYAFYFEQDSIGTYFDEEGASLRKAFLKAPLKFSRISSRYSRKRFHPVLKVNKPHLGTDYAAPHGTPIMSVGDGTVIAAAYTKGNGNYVKIRHNSTYTTQYLHMSKFGKGIKKGTKVRQGQVIGYVGSTGLATGPHVCYRFWKHGSQVDPLREKFPPSKPVDKDKKDAYLKQMEILKGELDALEQTALLQ